MLAVDETIHRVCGNYGDHWRHRYGSAVGSVCDECLDRFPSPQHPWRAERLIKLYPYRNLGSVWRDPQPCRNCGRPVVTSRRRKEPRYIVCGKECRQAVYQERARYWRSFDRKEKPCAICGERFKPKRTDADYCSPACKQKAYRARLHRQSAR